MIPFKTRRRFHSISIRLFFKKKISVCMCPSYFIWGGHYIKINWEIKNWCLCVFRQTIFFTTRKWRLYSKMFMSFRVSNVSLAIYATLSSFADLLHFLKIFLNNSLLLLIDWWFLWTRKVYEWAFDWQISLHKYSENSYCNL